MWNVFSSMAEWSLTSQEQTSTLSIRCGTEFGRVEKIDENTEMQNCERSCSEMEKGIMGNKEVGN